MPELPEVETVRRTLEQTVAHARVKDVRLQRDDVVTGDRTAQALLAGDRLVGFLRHGKQLALIGRSGRALAVHLGMTGRLALGDPPHTHAHVVWTLDDGRVLFFHDPRRFGGLWTYLHAEALTQDRFARLGEDALRISPGRLGRQFQRRRLPVKAALLDQRRIAGLGNIYVDELLHRARLHPLRPAGSLTASELRRLVDAMRRLLRRAIDQGGSTLRDYVDAEGRRGGFQLLHRVYGRYGLPCRTCGQAIVHKRIAGRTTGWCPGCQPEAWRRGRAVSSVRRFKNNS